MRQGVRPASGRANAAIYYVPEGYSTAGPRLLGINAASEGQLRAMALHAGVPRLYAFAETIEAGRAFADAVRAVNPRIETEWIPTDWPERLKAVGTLMLPGPGLAAYAWMRRPAGARAFSLVGITHATASVVAQDAIAELWTTPVEPWDALICTSSAVRSMVSRVLDDQRDYLTERFGDFSAPGPQLPLIPLGVDTAAMAPDHEARAQWRARLGLAPDEVALLYVGRLSPWSKSNPLPLFLATAAAARQAKARLRLVLAGWFDTDRLEQAYKDAAELICPETPLTIVDGRGPARAGIWHAGDIFVAPIDNIQESFGLAPLEAMAAGLPVVASDWDGFRDTVRDGIDGLLAPTFTPPEGAGADLGRSQGARTLGADQFLGAVSQAVAIDVEALARAIASLADNPDLRGRLGRSGQARARAEYDWSVTIGRYQTLWRELEDRRLAEGAALAAGSPNPSRPDPFRAFAAYPTAQLRGDMEAHVGATSPRVLQLLYQSPLVAFAHATLPELRDIEAMMANVETGPVRLGRLVRSAEPAVTAKRWRGVAWLIKYGFVRLG